MRSSSWLDEPADLCMEYSLLVIDDDDDDFMLLTTHIKQCHQNITLTYAQDGPKAINELEAGRHPNLILVDAQMPLMNGYEFLVWLMGSEAYRHIPVVIWTGAMSPSDVTRHYRAGANAVVLKQDALRDVDTFCQHWLKMVQLPQLIS